jgi:uncharacterized membrane protein YeaQ/YmgE (transglycosylase-associated protein family)
MDKVLQVAIQMGWPVAIVGVVGAVVNYMIARQFGQLREELRALRVSMEHSPSQEQIRRCLTLWPELAQYPSTIQLGEMVKRTTLEEGKRAQRKESALTITRIFVFVAVVGAALIVTGMFYKP